MFKFLRSQAKVFYWVIAGTFILFLFLGGMTGRGCQAPGSASIEPGVVGSVNGDKITSQQFDYAVRQQIAQMRQQNRNQDLNANQYAAAREQAWDALVRNLLVEQAVAERKIAVSDDEILNIFQNDPPPEILAQFQGEDGTVDMDAYFAALQNPENDWSSAEAYLRSLVPRQKLNDEIAGTATVADQDVREEYVRQTARAVAEYVGVLFADVTDETEPTEEEIKAWYDNHPDDYQIGKQAQATVVRFAKEASEADAADVLLDIQDIREEILSGEIDFEIAASRYSEDTGSGQRGGDLGRFDRNRMVEPFTEVAFNLPVGDISEPVRTEFGYHIIEVLERDEDPETGEATEISARHILLKIQPGPDSLDLIRESADAFIARVDESSFASTAEAEALDLVTPGPVLEGRDIPSLPLSLQGTQWLFEVEPGAISPVFENKDNFYVVLAGEPIPAGVRPLDEVRGQVTLALRKDRNLIAAKAKLAPAVGEIQMGRTLAEVAQSSDLAHAVTDTFTANGNVDGVGYGTDFNLAVIKGTVGEVLPEIETLRGVFAAVPLWISEIDDAEYEQRQAGIRDALLQRAQSEIISTWFEERLDQAEIVDFRPRLRQRL